MNYTFEGTLTEKDAKQHLFHSFDLPAQVTQLELHLHFTPAKVNNISNMLCLTLFDPRGFRGAGHRGGNNHQVKLSSTTATPGYEPGPLPPGPWRVEIDTHMVMPGEPCHYRLEVSFATTSEILPPSPSPGSSPAMAPVSRGPGWYRGDLHSHTQHSDGQQDVQGLVETARQRGLDFIFLTDHNTVSGLDEMEQRATPQLLTLGGLELTTFWGHAVCLGSREWIDWRVGLGQQTMAQIAGEVTAREQLFIIAHPCSTGDPWCTGCDWRYEEMKPGSSHFVEIWNGPWEGDSNNEEALRLYYAWLNQGHHLVATAGSDTHGAKDYKPSTGFSVIYAESLTETALFQALRQGHLYLSAGPHLTLTASTGAGQEVMMGDILSAEEAVFTVTWQDCPATANFRVMAGGEILLVWPAGQGSSHSWALSSTQARWCLVEVRDQNGRMLAITNPIFVEPKN